MGFPSFLHENEGEKTTFDRESLPIYNTTPAPQVEFEIRHTREHLEKLKFNWLELHTKRAFLTRLTDAEEWRACQTTRWTPGELKQLERELEPSKTRLKAAKAQTTTIERTLADECDALVTLQTEVHRKHAQAKALLRQFRDVTEEAATLQQKLPATPPRSVEELLVLLDEQGIALEKRATAVERQRSAVADLERLLAVHDGENIKLLANREELEAKRAVLARREGGEERALAGLCQWYVAICDTLARLGGCRVEMVKPDYLLATVSGNNGVLVPVHISVDALSGKLKGIKVGSTSSTPKRQWKELIDAAIEFNDIPFLLRGILSSVTKN